MYKLILSLVEINLKKNKKTWRSDILILYFHIKFQINYFYVCMRFIISQLVSFEKLFSKIIFLKVNDNQLRYEETIWNCNLEVTIQL